MATTQGHWLVRLAFILGTGALIALLCSLWYTPTAQIAYATGACAALAFAFSVSATGGTRGEDGRSSSSKLQFAIWTTAFIFSVVAMLAMVVSTTGKLPEGIPPYIFAAMGLSSFTMIGAQGIARHQVTEGTRAAPSDVTDPNAPEPKGGFFTSDDGTTSLTKVQMLFFNTLGAALFVILTCRQLKVGEPYAWPDVDATILMMCGLGSATYIGRKLVPAIDPTILRFGMSGDIKAGTKITVRGANFGAAAGLVMFDGNEITVPDADWSPQAVSFTVPATRAGVPWTATPIAVDVMIERADGLVSNAMKMNVKA